MQYAFAFVAGIVSTLSPCVLPLLPIVLGAAVTEHRCGPVALAAGLALSFVAVGLFVATIGFSIGLDQDVFRLVAAVLLALMGIVLLLPRLQARAAVAAGPISDWMQRQADGISRRGLSGQFAMGLLLGALWIPCVGPTLGAVSILASQGKNLGEVATAMFIFGLGAAVPLAALGTLSREAFLRWRGRLAATGQSGKMLLGGALIVIGLLVLTGFDKRLETALVEASPAWLTALTTRF